MAYSKKTWKARQGTGLNKFILGTVDSQGRQTITNLPDQITESGDALSADNFNDFEDRIEDGFTDVDEELESHTSNTNNPHGVTKTQIGLGNVDNTSDLDKPISDATQIALDSKADASSLESHTSNTDNPHGVTKAQIGLGNVDNTSDLDKPISTDVQNALNLKADRDIDGIAGNIATLDSNGNSIDSNFPINEVARKDVVISNSKRIANLEDKSAPYTIEYPSDDYGKGDIPANIEKGAVVKSVDGNTRRWNQVIANSVSGTYTGTPIAIGDGTGYRNITTIDLPTLLPVGHVYMTRFEIVSMSSNVNHIDWARGAATSTYSSIGVFYSINEFATGSYYFIRVYTSDTNDYSVQIKVNLYDLTLYCEGQNVPTTVAEALALNPEFGKFHAFDTGSLVKLKVGGYRFTSRNLIAESNIELGGISPVGVPYEATSGTWWRSADFIEVKPARTYYVKLPSGYTTANANIYAYYYDEDGNFISRGVNVAGTVITTPNSCFKVKLNYYFVTATLVTPTEICLNLSDSKNGTYTAHSSQSVEFSSPVELGKAGSVKDRLDTLDNTVKRNVGYGTISSSNATLEGATSTRTQFRIALPSNTIYTDSSVVPNLTVVGFETVSQNESSTAGQAYCRIADNSYFVVFVDAGYDLETFLSEYGGTEFTYELASPTTEPISVPSAIEVEPYGTIELIQEQDIEIDTEFSIQYIPDSQYITKSMVVDSLSSESTDVPLSANQGRILGGLVSRAFKAIANLIQRVGTFLVQYPDSIYGRGEVPSGMAKFAEVSCLRGVTRVANQLMPPLAAGSSVSAGVTIVSDGNGRYTLSGTSDSYFYKAIEVNFQNRLTVGHKYLIVCNSKSGNVYIGDSYSSSFDVNGAVIYSYTAVRTIYLSIHVNNSGYVLDETIKPTFIDLTVYFGSDPSVDVSTLTIADIEQNYPELLTPRDYDAGSLVDITYSAVESEGKNLATINSFTQSTSYETIIPCVLRRGLTYTASGNSSAATTLRLHKQDGTYQYVTINVSANVFANSFTPEDDVVQISFYNSLTITNLQIELGSTATSYSPYFKSVFTLPSPVTLPSAGSVADTDELCVEVDGVEKRRKTKRIGSYTFTGNETPTSSYQRANGDWYCVFQSIFNDGKNGGEGLSDKGIPFTTGNIAYNGTVTYFVTRGEGGLAFYLAGATSASAVMAWISANLPKVYYELTTPIVTLTDPIPDNFVQTEAGGTITPKQTQTPEIDSKFDMNYLAL